MPVTRHIRKGKKKGKRQRWRTSRELARWLVEDHGIELDAAALPHNRIVDRFIAPPGFVAVGRDDAPVAVDALQGGWGQFGRVAFCNPEFSTALAFVVAGVGSVLSPPRGVPWLRRCVFLLPANPDTRWFRLLVDVGARVGFFASDGTSSGRIPFEPEDATVDDSSGAAFPCLLAVLDRGAAPRPAGAPFVADLLDPATGRSL